MYSTTLNKINRTSLWIHHIIIFFGLFLLLQELIAVNVKNIPFLFQFIKYSDEGVSFILFFIIFFDHIYKKQSIKKTEIDLFFIIFFLIGILSSIIQKVPFIVFSSQFIIYIKVFLFFYIFIYLPIDIKLLEQYMRVFFWTGCILFFFGIIDLAAPYQFRLFTGTSTFVDFKNNIPSVRSLFFHPAVFGWFMNYIGLYCFASYFVNKRGVFLFFGIIFFTGCCLSMRVKAIIGFIASLYMGYMIYPFKYGKKVVTFVLSIIMIIIFIILGSLLFDLIETKYSMYFGAETHMDAVRNILYYKSIDIARDTFPFGAGFGRYASWTSRIHYSPVYYQYGLSLVWGLSEKYPNFISDTYWPMIIGETGFVGCGFFIIIFLIIIRILYKNVRKRKNPFLQVFYLGTFMIFIESLIESIAAPVYVNPPFAFFLFGAFGIAFALKRVSD